jgi:Glycosyl hydrolase family 26
MHIPHIRADGKVSFVWQRGIRRPAPKTKSALIFSLMLSVATANAVHAASAAQLGVYVDWGSPAGRESNVEAFEKWLGDGGLLALDFLPGGGWSELAQGADWQPGFWQEHNASRNLVWSVPLTLRGTNLNEVAAGGGDATFARVAAKIAWAQPNAVIRLGWEMNGDWFAWSAARGQAAAYVAAFRHVVPIFRAASRTACLQYGRCGTLVIDWCVNAGPAHLAAEEAYPGDRFVDVVGMDIYDANLLSRISPAAAWRQYLNGSHGLEWHRAFAAAHHKPMSYPEWAIGKEGDNPTFVSSMKNWIDSNNVAYADYWNTNASYPGMISNGQYPKSAAAFKR